MNNDDGRSPLAIGYAWSVIISTIALEMTLPALFGFWLDYKFGTLILFTIIGAVLGMITGMTHLIQITKRKMK
ncbi:MAG: hypothetical protein ACRC2T_17875 [Thermoguttaceae bacterium]